MINITKNLGMLLLAIYLILAGLGLLVHTIVIPAIIMGILALAAGILILIGRKQLRARLTVQAVQCRGGDRNRRSISASRLCFHDRSRRSAGRIEGRANCNPFAFGLPPR